MKPFLIILLFAVSSHAAAQTQLLPTPGPSTNSVNQGYPPVIDSIAPRQIIVNRQDTVKIYGLNFVSGSIILVNGQPASTLSATAYQMTFTVPCPQIPSAGNYTIQIKTPNATVSNVLIIAAVVSNAPIRIVNWLHGLGEHGAPPQPQKVFWNIYTNPTAGEDGWYRRQFWRVFADQFDASRYMESNQPEFTGVSSTSDFYFTRMNGGLGGIPEIADALHNFSCTANRANSSVGYFWRNCLPTNGNPEKPLLIGHSTGGVVARQMDLMYAGSPKFGGIITVGTPHLGADALAAARDGSADKLQNEATLALGAPLHDPFVLAAAVAGTGIVSLMGGFETAYNAAASLFDGRAVTSTVFAPIASDIVQIAARTYAGYPAGILKLMVSNPQSFPQKTLDDLDPRQFNSPPGISSTVLPDLQRHSLLTPTPRVNIWGSTYNRGHLRLAYSLMEPPYKEPDKPATDDALVVVSYILQGIYGAAGIAHLAIGAGMIPLAVANPILWLAVANEASLYVHYNIGMMWMQESERYWARLIGATRKERVRVTRWYLFIPITTEEEIEYITEYDGFLSQRTQQYPGIALTDNQRNFRAVGANHFTEGNHKSTRDALESVFNNNPNLRVDRRR